MPRRKNDASKMAKERVYFSQETENAIIEFNTATDMDVREQIFREHILRPLDKMAENIINRFKFPYINNSFDETKKQVVSFLVINLSKYTQEKGKAFSYLSVVAKNYLIYHNTKEYKRARRNISLSDSGETFVPIDEMVSLEARDVHANEDTIEFIQLMVAYWDANLLKIFKKKRDIDIAQAVIELFRRSGDIENFNKKALYLTIREMTDCKTSYITKVVNKMREIIVEHMAEYHEHGTVGGKTSTMRIY